VNLLLRVVAAAVQIVATFAIVSVLPPTVAGVYFKGFVITYGLAAVLRGKYDLFVARHFLGRTFTGVADRELVRGLGIRVLVRSAIACAVLLVVTTDLDVMEPHLRPYLETYLPFVLAVPLSALALFLSSVLRAVNRTLSSALVATYGINVVIIAVTFGASGSEDTRLMFLSWGFFAGTLSAAVVGVFITRYVFQVTAAASQPAAGSVTWRKIYASAGENGLTGLALAGLQWGPVYLLVILGTEIQIADYAVAARTAQAIELLLPATILVPHSVLLHSKLARAIQGECKKLTVDLIASLLTTSAVVAAVGVITPRLVAFYGMNYQNLTILFAVAFATQWLAGTSRPAIRHLVAIWNLPQLRRILVVSMIGALTISLAGITPYGALGAAVGVLFGAMLMDTQALIAAFLGTRCAT
jgi:hypothetical protein